MKKLFLSLIFFATCITTNAQSAVNRESFKSAPYDVVIELANDDVTILSNKFKNITDDQKTDLTELFYAKYKKLSTELSNDELTSFTDSIKTKANEILGSDIYKTMSKNKELFGRITGEAYLPNIKK